RVLHPVARGARAQVEMVVWIALVELDNVVVDVRDDERRPHALAAEALELQARHRPRGVLEQGLVDAELEIALAATRQVRLDDLLGQGWHRPGRTMIYGANPAQEARNERQPEHLHR